MRRPLLGLLLLGALTRATLSVAADDDSYATKPPYNVTLPPATTSFAMLTDAFGADNASNIDGFPLRSKILAAGNSSVYLQKNFGASSWLTVGNVVGFTMDPSFVKLSPQGGKVALGTGLNKPLYVFPTSTLSALSPPDLGAAPGTQAYDLSYYDADWRDSRYLFVNAGTYDNETPGSAIFVVDTEAAEPSSAVRRIIEHIPGASGGVTFDLHGNLISGNGYDYEQQARTGQLKIWSAADIAAALEPAAVPLDYVASGHVLAEHVLSAAWLGVDADNNLYVGGGDAFGNSGDYGYAGLVSGSVLTRVLAGGAPMDREAPGEFREIAPDPCRNDDATSVLYVPGIDMLSVSYQAHSLPPSCDLIETTGGGEPPHQQLYFPPGAPDTDGDGVPDGADNAYQTANPDQVDSDGDGYGDVADCDADNDGFVGRAELSRFVDLFGVGQGQAGFDPLLDRDADGVLGLSDFALLKAGWGKAAVCE